MTYTMLYEAYLCMYPRCPPQLGQREAHLKEAMSRQQEYQRSIQSLSKRLEAAQQQALADLDLSDLTAEELADKLDDHEVGDWGVNVYGGNMG